MEEKKKRKPRGLRADGRIMVTYTDGRKPDGSPNKLFFYGRTRGEAEAKRDQYKEYKKAGLRYEDRKITVNDWVDRWIEVYSIDTMDYGTYIKRLRRDIGAFELRGIREGDLIATLGQYEGRSKSGATKYRMVLKQVFHRAYKNHLIPDDPAEDLELPDVTEGTHRALERWEIDSIMEHWRIYPAGRWAMIMLFCGLRRGEMIALDWSAVDMDARTMTVNRAVSFKSRKRIIKETKSEAGMRVLPLTGPVYDMLAETRPELRTGPVCLSAEGRPLSADTVRRNWQTFCRAMTNVLNGQKPLNPGRRSKAGKSLQNPGNAVLEDSMRSGALVEGQKVFSCEMHDLRHTYATMLFEAGIEPKDMQYYLGHKDLRMTMELYTHLTEDRRRKTLSQVTGYLDEWLNTKEKRP